MRATWNAKKAIPSILPVLAAWVVFFGGTSAASTWQVDRVDYSAAGQFSSLKIDKDGNAHVAYVLEDEQRTLKYGFWDHILKRWFVMPVAVGASFCSLALDSKQHPHISWSDHGAGSGARLRY